MVKFSKETIEEIIKKYNSRDENGKKKYSQTEIAKEYRTNRANISAISQGFESYEDYQQQKAEEKDFGSHADRLRYIAKERGIEIPNNKKPVKKFNKNLESKVEE